MNASDIENAPYGLFRIGRFGTGKSHVCKVVDGKAIPCCRMFGGVGRMGNKPAYIIPGGKPEQATCDYCRPKGEQA